MGEKETSRKEDRGECRKDKIEGEGE